MKRTRFTAALTVAALAFASLVLVPNGQAHAQDIVVEEIKPDAPGLIDVLTNRELIDLWYDAVMNASDDSHRFDDSDLWPGDPWSPPPPPPSTNEALPGHHSPRPAEFFPH